MALRTSLVAQPHLYMGDTQGRPLDAGKVYFGEPNKDPELYPINVYYDETLTIAAPQPIRTMGGFMNANGQMVEIYAAETEYSVKVLDAYGRQVFYQTEMSSASTSTSVNTRLPYPGAVTRTVAEKTSDSVSLMDFGAKGDGITDDTAAFNLLESNVTGRVIDLQGKVYVVNKVPDVNIYTSGYFNIAGITHPSKFETHNFKFKKHCMSFETGNNYRPPSVIFGGSEQVFQSFCIVPQETGNPKLYVTNRAHRDDGTQQNNWLLRETYRIIEYQFKEDGSNVVATQFSQPLSIGHGAGLSYTIDESGQLWLYSGYPSDSETDSNRSNKGFSRIRWVGSATSNSNINYYQLFDYAEAANPVLPYYQKAEIAVSTDGKLLTAMATNDYTAEKDIVIYSLPDLLSAPIAKNVTPINIFALDKDVGLGHQGIAVQKDRIVTYYDAEDNRSAVKIFDFSGNELARLDFDTYRSYYSRAELRGAKGVLNTSESEGVFIYGNDIYVGHREYWNDFDSIVSYEGKYYAARANSTNVIPSGNPAQWQEIDAVYATGAVAWSASTNYTIDVSKRNSVNKRIYKITSVKESDSLPLSYTNDYVVASYKKLGVGSGGWVDYTMVSTPVILFPHLKGGTLIADYAGSRPVRTVSQHGETLLKAYGTATPLTTDTDSTVEMWIGSNKGSNRVSIQANTSSSVIASRNGNNLHLATYSGDTGYGSGEYVAIIMSGNGNKDIRPNTANAINLGNSPYTFKNIYLQNAPIVTSDERLKQDFRKLKAAEKKAAIEIKESICLYKMKDSVAEKGDEARWHVGVKAQQIVGIMESHGLQPFEYGFICHDEWDAQDAEIDDDGNEVQAAREAGDKYAVRYDELTMFILASI